MADHDDDIARLIHETLAQLEWPGDPAAIAARVKSLDRGLPAEDEFMVLSAWLGQCGLIHKLDQAQMPGASKAAFQVPDLFASYMVDGQTVPVLIEAKVTSKNVLSFTPAYIARLQAYADLLGLPLLIAWKWRFIWCLFEARHLTQKHKNFNIDWKTALMQSLMGVLAGDFSYALAAGAGMHIGFRKTRKTTNDEPAQSDTETWETVIDDVYFTDGAGRRVKGLPRGVQSVVMIADLDTHDEVSDTHIIRHFIAQQDMALFAQTALIRLLAFRNARDEIHWRRYVTDGRVLEKIANFREAVTAALDRDLVHHVIAPRPRTMPAFLRTTGQEREQP